MTYSDTEAKIGRETIYPEIIPDTVLLPNMGTQGVMWQEIEGKRRTTPGRLMVSAISTGDLNQIFIRMTGDFRWEMCKRVQGAHWHDISERSLTSEYADFIQFYKKNQSLSATNKEQIKTNLQKVRNSEKEMFIRDYITWIMFEGNGSPRLNKQIREILFTYCPFSQELRERLKINPLYSTIIEKYESKNNQRIRHLESIFTRLKKDGLPIPDELQQQLAFLKH